MTYKHKLAVLLLTTFCSISYSQFSEDEPQNIVVNWKVGEEKTIYQIDSTLILSGDSVFMQTAVKTDYKIKIKSKKDTIYEVLFKQININSNIELESDVLDANSLKKSMQSLMEEMKKEMIGFEYSFLVNQNTGQAIEVKNQRKLEKKIEELVVVFLNQYLDSSAVESTGIDKEKMKLFIKQYLDEQMPAAIQTVLNSFNYIFQAYSFPFIMNKTYTVESSVYEVNEIKHGKTETNAKFIVNSSFNEPVLTINHLYDYDKQQAYNQYVVAQGRRDDIPISEFEIYENIDAKFNFDSSWIINSKSTVKVKMKDIRVLKTTNVIIN